ncbi:MAG TPA: TolC family protein [Gemmatimonadaceae bacterium]|nr:TolC family protein [Gemmatimonadaceae bacterium]
MRPLTSSLIALLAGATLSAQAPAVRQISLEEAVKLADRSSEVLDIARAAVTRTNGQQFVARSQFLPQIGATASYAKTLRSQFEGLSFSAAPDTSSTALESLCTPRVPAGATAAERQAALNQAQSCSQAGGGGFDFSSTGFGARNQWVGGLQVTQNIYTGGRTSGQRLAANSARNAADIELTAQRAQVILDVTQAYYNAVLAKRLAEIAQQALTWNDEVLRQTTRARQVGSSSEFDLLRAKVARDNQVPVVLQRRNDGEVAMLRLKQLIEIPLDDSLELTTSLDEEPAATDVSNTAASLANPDTNVEARSTVREAVQNVKAQEGLVRVARADRLPTIQLTSGYQRLWFPLANLPALNDFRENWTVGVTANLSLFSGGRVHGNDLVAQANLREAKARLKQSRELAALDARVALAQLRQAEATWNASAGTAEQARRAYSIDQIRYKEGIATQTDLTQSQLLADQAMVNRAVAARDLAVARMRVGLLKDLPLSAAAGAQTGTMNAGAAGGNVLAVPPQPTRTPSASSTSGSSQ